MMKIDKEMVKKRNTKKKKKKKNANTDVANKLIKKGT